MRLTTLLPLLGSLPGALSQSYKEYNFTTPIDHFHNETRYEPHSNGTFNLRYWFDSQYYKPGGPVFVIAAGETDGEDRFPFLSQGIVTQLAETYHGLGVILEHRYYGSSYPFDGETITPEELRFLSTEQSLADYVHFAKNVVFEGLEEFDLTAPSTPWIAYGGSYAGAQVAFMRKVYPEIFWGAVSSSGVTAAIVDYWNYYEPIRLHAPEDCIETVQTITDVIDRIFIDHPDDEDLHAQLQAAYGLSRSINNTDFVNILQSPLGNFQSRNWDPETGSYEFRHYCDNLTAQGALYPPNNGTAVLPKILQKAGYNASDAGLLAAIRNNIGYLNLSNSESESESESSTAESNNNNTTTGLPKSSGTSWNYQVCTEWGYFMPGSTVPSSIRPLISRLIDLEYTSSFCSSSFGITTPPDVDRINKHGSFNFSYPRVAIIGGAADPWRDATPHATGLESRVSTDQEPFILSTMQAEHVWDGIEGSVHHWDQNGLSEEQIEAGVEVPREIGELWGEISRFVGVWLGEWEGEEDL
ncbi:putative extracelular serine carboxypeptidase [Aspergillus stella-maris]|uniref:putative extracelular serine carboxypeptidase n=1 Tax=Aspergillus stella-maris TaxID=1810926 RepID=UPI003CCDD12C